MSSPSLNSLLIKSKVAEVSDSGRMLGTQRIASAARSRETVTTSSISRDARSTYRFFRHYAEMVAVMFAGMYLLMAPTGWLFSALGTSWSGLSPAMNTFAMALTMVVPMVGWMHLRGHAWRANVEMAASMIIPTFAIMAVLWTGIAKGGLMVPEHAGMLACMLIAMLLRRDEYAGVAHHAGHAHPALAA